MFINNEDGYSYRWDLATDTITQAVEITNGYGEPYTPTSIGPNGVVYALNGGTLFALGGYTNYTLTNVTSPRACGRRPIDNLHDDPGFHGRRRRADRQHHLLLHLRRQHSG